MGDFAVYDSSNVTLLVSDIPIKQGLADPFIKISWEGDAFDDDVGADGSVCRFATHETRFTAELTLKAWSEHNAVLSALHAIDTATPGGSGVGGFLLKDNNGSTVMAAAQCWIQAPPDPEFGKNRPDVTWKFRGRATRSTMIIGGNSGN